MVIQEAKGVIPKGFRFSTISNIFEACMIVFLHDGNHT